MNNEMFVKIMNIKKGNNDELIEVIEMFKPLIRKYSKMIDGEDTEQDLKIFLINLLNKIPVDSDRLYEDKAIFAYIAKSLRSEYIKLSKKRDKKILNEVEIDLEVDLGSNELESEIELLDMFKVLSEKEAYIIKLIYVYYLSVTEVAEYMNISRQAVNKTKNRALNKIKKIYLT